MQLDNNVNINPWREIWFKPRNTIKSILETSPGHRFVVLSVLSFLSVNICTKEVEDITDLILKYEFKDLNQIIFYSLMTLMILPFAIFILALIKVYFETAFIFLSGKLLKGKATFESVKTAIVWSSVPFNCILILFLIKVIFYCFAKIVGLGENTFNIYFVDLVLFSELILILWSFVIFIICLSEVQKFSIIKAIFNCFILFVLLIPLFFLVITIFFGMSWLIPLFLLYGS